MDIPYDINNLETNKYSIEIEENDYLGKHDRVITECGTVMLLTEIDKILIPIGFGVNIPKKSGKLRYHSRFGDSYWFKRFGQHARWLSYILNK